MNMKERVLGYIGKSSNRTDPWEIMRELKISPEAMFNAVLELAKEKKIYIAET